jgi:hypothetical protein
VAAVIEFLPARKVHHMLRRYLPCLCLVGIWPLSTAFAQSPLASVPEDAAIVVRIASVESLEEGLTAFAEEIQEGAGENASTAIYQALGEIVQSEELEGVDLSKDWYIVLFANGPQPPSAVLMIPATDADAVLSNLPAAGVSRDGYVLASPNNGDVESLLDAGESNSVLKEIPDSESFNSAHVAVFINADHLVSTYSNEIDMAQRQINQALDQVAQLQIPDSPIDMSNVVDIYRGILEWVDDVLADAEALTVTATVIGTDIVIDKRLQYRAGSESAEGIVAGEAGLADAFANLPEGMPIYYAASGAGMAEMMEFGMGFTLSMVEGDEAAEMEEMIGRLSELGFGAMSGCISLPDGDMPLRGVTMLELDDVEAYRELMNEMNAAFSDIDLGAFRQTTTVEADAETYGDYSADLITVTQEYEGAAAAEQERIQEYMFGEDGMVSRVIYSDEAVLTTVGGGPELMEAAIAAYESGDQDLSAWSEGALENSTVLVLFDLPGFARQMLGFVVEAGQGQVPVPPELLDAVDELELEQSYITISTASDENAVLARISIPAAQIRPLVMLAVPVATGPAQ